MSETTETVVPESNLVARLQESVEKLEARVQAMAVAYKSANGGGYQAPKTTSSPEINEIAGALAKAQGEMKSAGEDAVNPHYKSKYADLTSIIRTCRGPLSKNGLSFTQQVVVEDNGQSNLYSMVMHTSGQWLGSRLRITPVSPKGAVSPGDMQAYGSGITYCKRYALSALLGIATGDDDDGEKAMQPVREVEERGTKISSEYDPSEQSLETISPDQLKELQYELAQYPDIAKQVMNHLKLDTLADMPSSAYRFSIERIRKMKKIRNNPD